MREASFHNLDCDVHYWHRLGTGDQHILFFHGAGVDHEMFEPQTGVGGDSSHLVFWDARGHGASQLAAGRAFSFEDMIDDCRKLYETLGIDEAILVGQSMGGNLAQEIACRHPEMVRKLVLIDCTKNTGKLTVLEKLTLKASSLIFACYPWGTLIRQSADACGNKAEVKQYVRRCFQRMDKATFIDIMGAVTGCLHEDVAFRFPQPVLLLCGADDKSGNIRASMTAWAQADENCTLFMIENAGHNANQDQPEAVNRHISDFL